MWHGASFSPAAPGSKSYLQVKLSHNCLDQKAAGLLDGSIEGIAAGEASGHQAYSVLLGSSSVLLRAISIALFFSHGL